MKESIFRTWKNRYSLCDGVNQKEQRASNVISILFEMVSCRAVVKYTTGE